MHYKTNVHSLDVSSQYNIALFRLTTAETTC